MGNKLALLAILLAGLALLLQVVDGGDERGTNAGAIREVALGPVLARIEALESENERLRAALEAVRLAPPAVPERQQATSDPRLDQLEQRVAELERRPETAGQGAELQVVAEAAQAEFLRRNTPRETTGQPRRRPLQPLASSSLLAASDSSTHGSWRWTICAASLPSAGLFARNASSS